MNTMPLVDAALQYARLGYPVFPCVPNGKTPLTPHGFKDASTDPAQIAAWWTQWPAANVAIPTEGLAVIDTDGENNPWPGDPERAESLMDACRVLQVTPRKGHHRVFRQPAGRAYRNTASALGDMVDTRANGGYIVVAPSVVDGKAYTWIDGYELDCKPEDLPEPPGWLVSELDGLAESKPATDAERASASLDAGDFGQPDDVIPDGQRNSTLTSYAGKLRRDGSDEDEILALLRVRNAKRCRPPLDDAEVLKIVRSVCRYEPDQNAQAVAEGWYEADRGDRSSCGQPSDPGPFPEHLLAVPGFVGDLVEYTTATAFRRLPAVALAGAMSLLGVLTGRKVRDEGNTRTNVYTFGVAPSGSGKDWPRDVNKEVLIQADAAHLLGPEGFASHAGLIAAVEVQPAVLFQLDEFGRNLKTMGDPRNAHLYNITTNLMRLYSSAGSSLRGDAYADTSKTKIIQQPHACLFSTTVPKSLYEGLTYENVTDGFLSRVLIFESEMTPKARKQTYPIPRHLIEIAKHWARFCPSGNLNEMYPDPMVVPVTAMGQDSLDYLNDLADNNTLTLGDPYGTLWTRTGENAQKLALLYACSRDHEDPVVDADAANWACELAEYLTRRLCHLVARWVSDGLYDEKRKRILRVISEAGTNGLTSTQLLQRTRSIPRRDREEIIDALKAVGDILCTQESTHGRPRLRYISANTVQTSG